MTTFRQRFVAILQAAFVTFLWSTSWVLIKFGLRDSLPPVTFAGLRYTLAFACLLPLVAFNRRERAVLRSFSRADWLQLTLLGLLFYTLAQGAQFVSLAYLPAVMVNLLLNLTPVAVGFMSILWFDERPTALQWAGVLLCLFGTGVYFFPVDIPAAQGIGILAAAVGVLANTGATLLGRNVNRQAHFTALTVTFVSMGIGSLLMLVIGLLTQGIGTLSPGDWAIIVWLAVVNTAFTFTLWNHTQRTLTAVETSVINSLMMPQIAILAVVFLGETLSGQELFGLTLVGVGVLVVQLKKREKIQIESTQEEESII